MLVQKKVSSSEECSKIQTSDVQRLYPISNRWIALIHVICSVIIPPKADHAISRDFAQQNITDTLSIHNSTNHTNNTNTKDYRSTFLRIHIYTSMFIPTFHARTWKHNSKVPNASCVNLASSHNWKTTSLEHSSQRLMPRLHPTHVARIQVVSLSPSTCILYRRQGLPFEAIDQSLSLIDRLNTRQAIEFSIAY